MKFKYIRRSIIIAGFIISLSIILPSWGNWKSRELTLVVENQSFLQSNVCIYQSPPKTSPQKEIVLAWFCQPLPKKLQDGNSQVVFKWTEDYYFVWTQKEHLTSQIHFMAYQTLPAKLRRGDKIKFTKIRNQTYTFIVDQPNDSASLSQNSILINQDGTIQPTEVLVGIGMAQLGTAMVSATPNTISDFSFSGEFPQYWIFFGNKETGDVLNVNDLEKMNEIEVKYQGTTTSMTAVLQEDNTWSIK